MLDVERAWTQQALMKAAVAGLSEAGVPEARRNVEWLLGAVLGCDRARLYAYPERSVPPEAVRRFDEMLVRRARREPLQYILEEAHFFGLRLRVTPAVLIPRPETEQVVEAALALLAGRPAPRVLDVGTGSGCIALALKHTRPDASVAACDVSRAALAVARENAARLGLEVAWLEADLLAPDFPGRVPGNLDLLVSNPPYVPPEEAPSLAPEVAAHEPHRALFTGPDPLGFYRVLVRVAPVLVRPGGHVVFETHAGYGAAVRDLLEAGGFEQARLQADLAGQPRIVSARRP
ncbi:peptide chain release factor N(5)-glutamine methyltransferase [Rhodocaloribacter litoris]|uniref:peptide chain release factor N(5)-glutamine methyltransferase n=1 Tax=Rhodocaloribacter litoris TaxID=2558931 RepID=UPI00141FFB54|nr:peptide chain release factor N(5)-glutamine methyltransferase [Rhodocaloribacter litoris]QXD16447.1 peptide chain release factor N(5)-glutamine methyltransferase [Rhodocaloribacter litoris]GIV59415.1 MAG: release factor glutamine methyltransferase [Rhodothermaceae bacterium]